MYPSKVKVGICLIVFIHHNGDDVYTETKHQESRIVRIMEILRFYRREFALTNPHFHGRNMRNHWSFGHLFSAKKHLCTYSIYIYISYVYIICIWKIPRIKCLEMSKTCMHNHACVLVSGSIRVSSKKSCSKCDWWFPPVGDGNISTKIWEGTMHRYNPMIILLHPRFK